MKRFFKLFDGIKGNLKKLPLLAALVLMTASSAFAYMAKYKEDYLKLYHIHKDITTDDCLENIYYLEKAIKAPFANPLYAMAKIETEEQWEKYRYLFMMHTNLKIIEQYIRLGSIYDKKVAYFYDAPWKDMYLDNLQKAKTFYEYGYYYWQEAQLWAEKASTTNFNFLYITDQQAWEDERYRITTGALDYKKTLDRELKRLNGVIDAYVAMESKNY